MKDAFEKIQMMLDDQTSTILLLTSKNPRTASQLCREMRIPRSVCYRKLKTLISEQLLDVSRSPRRLDGENHATRYVSNIDKAYVSLEQGELMTVLKFKNERQSHISRISSDAKTC